eukprot:10028188-Alexandrium_andersonii.AAC.1
MGVIRAGVLAQPRIPQHQRVSLYDSLAVSKLLFNAQIWGALTQQHLARLQSTYMRGFRVVAGTPESGSHSTLGTTDVAVMASLGIVHVATRVWKARMLYVARAVRFAPPILMALWQMSPRA